MNVSDLGDALAGLISGGYFDPDRLVVLEEVGVLLQQRGHQLGLVLTGGRGRLFINLFGRDAPDTDFAGYPVNLKAGYQISSIFFSYWTPFD